MKSANPEWKSHAIVGFLLVLNTMTLKFSIAGPWDSASFTLGIIGLSGLTLLYIAWYRFTFKRKGLVPWLDLWQNPSRSAPINLILGLIILVFARIIATQELALPAPSSLILTLVGLLMVAQSAYVILSIGILADED